MTFTRKTLSRVGIGLLLLSSWFLSSSLSAQDHTPASLRMVPADAATYSAMLHGREQLDAVLKSKAWAKLISLPVVKMGWQMVEADWANPEGKLAQLRSWYDQPGHAEIVRFLGELFEEEVFSYGGKNTVEFSLLMQDVQAANQMAPFQQLIKDGIGGDPNQARIKGILQALAANHEHVVVPNMVMGFKLSRTKPAQIAKWLDALEKTVAQAAPPLAQKMKKMKIHGADVYTLTVSGDMIPWDMIPLAQFEDKAGEYDKLVKHVKETKLTVALTVRHGYLLLGIGEGTAALQAVGEGLPNRLASSPEFAPLAKFAANRLTNVGYVSKTFAQAIAGDTEDLAAWAKDLIKDANLPAEKKAKIEKEIKALAVDLKRIMPQPGAVMAFTFSTKRGFEGYSYDWSKNHGLDASKPLKLLEHVGGNPLAFVISREQTSTESYDLMVRMVKLGADYFDDLALPQLPENFRQPYQDFMKEAAPLLKRFHRATDKLMLPALGGQTGFVFDAHLKSRQWHAQMPGSDKDLGLPEVAIIQSVKDAAKLREAFKEYLVVYNGLVDILVKQVGGAIPDLKLPEPKMKKIGGATFYSYQFPEDFGLDPRVAPTAGLSDKLIVYALSQDHAQRLLTPTPFKTKGGPLADPARSIATAAYFDFAGFVDMAGAWVEYGLIQAGQGNDVIEQAQSIMDILKVMRSYASITYFEDGVVVTHGETIIRDLEK